MDRVFSALYRFLIRILLLICGGLFVFGLFRTIVFRQNTEDDLPEFVSLNPFLTVLIFAALVIVLKWLLDRTGVFSRTRVPRRIKAGGILPGRWFLAVILFAAGFCAFLLFVIRGLPTNDARLCYEIAQSFIQGDYHAIDDGYLAVYPFQISLCLINEWMIGAFGAGNYLPMQLLNLLSILLSLLFLYETAWELTDDIRVPSALCVLAFGCWMLYAYTTFIYNDIISLAPLYGALYFLIIYLKRGYIAAGVTAAILACITCTVKTNGAVAIVARSMVIFVRLLQELKGRRWRRVIGTLLVLGLTVLASFIGSRAVYRYYESVSGLKVRDGVPAMAYFAMGMTENGNGLYGWYSGDNVRYLTEAGMDSQKAASAAGDFVSERARFFVTHPKSLLKFYGIKFLSQWADPTKVSLREQELTGLHQEGVQPQFAQTMIYGSGYHLMQGVMHAFHLLLYFFAFFGLRSYVRGKRTISEAQILLPLFIFGGMLFHELWEASGRYALRYELALLPFAAMGMVSMFSGKLMFGKNKETGKQ